MYYFKLHSLVRMQYEQYQYFQWLISTANRQEKKTLSYSL